MRSLWLAALAAFLVDQWSKFYVFGLFRSEALTQIDVAPPYLVFRKGMNTGVNFGLFADSAAGQRWLLIVLSVALCGMLFYWARKNFHSWKPFASAGLIIGGAIGNAFDRLLYPGVRDFLNMSCCGFENPYVFNVADVFIFAGAFGLILFTGDSAEREKPS